MHHGQGQWNGVAILSRVGIDDVTTGFDEDHVDPYEGDARVLAATCDGVRVVSVYVPNGREVGTEFYDRKLVWLDALHDWLAAHAEHPTTTLVVLGDFNVAPEDRDLWSPKAFEGVDPRHASPSAHAVGTPPRVGHGRRVPRAVRRQRAVHLLGLPPRRLPPAPRHAHRPRRWRRGRWRTAPAGRSSTATPARASNRPITRP